MEIEKYIPQAEKIFLGNGTFDDERKTFIKNIETCDLLAVPGSGKTTALIAKLYCIAQNMPFEDGSGILVLAHTNNAVDEIEKKLKKHCPQLFEYPNFVGTIQGFINRFLTIPLYNQKNSNKFKIIEYEDYIKEFDYHLAHTKEAIAYFKNNNPSIYYSANLNINLEGTIYVCTENKDEEINLKCPPKWIKENTSEIKVEEVKKFIKETKIKIFQKGYLNYSDCYFYAKKNIFENPILKEILQKRFKYVFIDEMQDLEDYQIKIIDDIFFSDSSQTVIQRIGDPNQAIYNSSKKIKIECDWDERHPLFLKGSNRLTVLNSNLVNNFILDSKKDENGIPKFILESKKEEGIKPHLIVINRNTTGDELKNKFVELIKTFKLHQCDKNIKNGFKIISWNTVWDNDEENIDKKTNLKKLRLVDFYENYEKESINRKDNHKNLKDYLYHYDKEKLTLEAIRKSILNSFTRILDLEEIKDEKGRRYRKSTLMQFFKNQSEEFYNDFKAKLYSWCFRIVVHQQNEEVYKELVSFIKSENFIGLNWQDIENFQPKSILKSEQFLLSSEFQIKEEPKESTKKKEDIKIDLASVHAVKGQTHCATMYIESAYQRPTYDTQKIIKSKGKDISNPLLLEEHKCNGKYDKQALKMMYVGFSRPTHLLCFATLEENVKGDIEKYKKAGWVIIDELINNK